MSNNIVQFNEEIIKGQIKKLVRGSVEETLNELLKPKQKNSPRQPATSAVRPARATAAVIMTEILPPHPGM